MIWLGSQPTRVSRRCANSRMPNAYMHCVAVPTHRCKVTILIPVMSLADIAACYPFEFVPLQYFIGPRSTIFPLFSATLPHGQCHSLPPSLFFRGSVRHNSQEDIQVTRVNWPCLSRPAAHQ